MNDFNSLEVPGGNLGGVEGRDAAGKFRPVQIADANDVTGGEFAFAAGHTRRQQAAATFAERFPGARIDEESAFRMMKKCNPTFAPLQLRRLGDKERSFSFTGKNARQHLRLLS